MKLKTVLIGDSGVGKTTFMNKIIRKTGDRGAVADYEKIILNIGNKKIQTTVWDMSGCDKYKHITQFYLKNIDVAIIMYDMSNMKSVNRINYWFEELIKNHNEVCTIIIVGNKKELVDVNEYIRTRDAVDEKYMNIVDGIYDVSLLKDDSRKIFNTVILENIKRHVGIIELLNVRKPNNFKLIGCCRC